MCEKQMVKMQTCTVGLLEVNGYVAGWGWWMPIYLSVAQFVVALGFLLTPAACCAPPPVLVVKVNWISNCCPPSLKKYPLCFLCTEENGEHGDASSLACLAF